MKTRLVRSLAALIVAGSLALAAGGVAAASGPPPGSCVASGSLPPILLCIAPTIVVLPPPPAVPVQSGTVTRQPFDGCGFCPDAIDDGTVLGPATRMGAPAYSGSAYQADGQPVPDAR